MAINATSTGTTRELIPTGNYVARCYQMIHIGTIKEVIMGETKVLDKVRIGWELPLETKVFDEKKGPQPLVISQEYTLSMHEKSNLRKVLASWRGKDFTADEAKCFDVTKLLGVPCMLNIIHKPSKKDPARMFEEIGSVSPVPKGFEVPAQVNRTAVLQYDNFDWGLFDTLPDFIKQKIQGSLEFAALQNPGHTNIQPPSDISEPVDDLPF